MQKKTVSPGVIVLLMCSGLLGLSACQSKVGCSAQSTKCFSSNKNVFTTTFFKNNQSNRQSIPELNPKFNYMRVVMNGQPLWLAQGATTQFPKANTQVFYSADRSVFKWSNGRLISITTPSFYWRESSKQQMDWSAAKPLIWSRDIDTNTHVTVSNEKRLIEDSAEPQHHNYMQNKTELIWMHERTVSPAFVSHSQKSVLQSSANFAYSTFDSWYAFDAQNMNKPVYGQQCISKQYCLSWQVWKTN